MFWKNITKSFRNKEELRIVYDDFTESPGQDRSLNDYLPVGPNYIPQLVDVRARFRWNQIAISADNEKVFLKKFEGVPPKEQQSTEKISDKVYICLFTFALTCAIHLELTRDLGVNSFLQMSIFKQTWIALNTDIQQRQNV